MLMYIIRLDDACTTMCRKKWDIVEGILDKYSIQPIVGIIPDCMDEAEPFGYPPDENFWERAAVWQNKGWIIAQHGLHHRYYTMDKGTKLFQKSCADFTEFAGISCGEQKMMLHRGYKALENHGLNPKCFFAPGHTFDGNTVRACRELGYYDFISDGYALKPYKKHGMTFLPAISSKPRRLLPFGIYTFVLHPSVMTEEGFEMLEKFLMKEKDKCVSAAYVMEKCRIKRHQGIVGKMIETGMYLIRKWRNK